MPSPYQKFVAKWSECQRCTLCEKRTNVVLARGNVPCDVLFIGEAPGMSEDVLGKPFAGPAGHLLDQMIAQAIEEKGLRLCFTNLVCCIPKDELGAKVHEPPEEAVAACEPRLLEFVAMCDPKAVVYVGKLSEKHGPKFEGWLTAIITHPAAILRANVVAQPLMIKQCIVTLEDLFNQLWPRRGVSHATILKADQAQA